MAKLKVNNFDLFMKRRPNLPDWYRFLAYILGLIVAVVIFINLILPGDTSKSIDSNKNNLSTLATEVPANTEPNYTDKQINVLTYSGGTEKISSQALAVALMVSKSIVSGDFSNVPIPSGDVAPLYNIASDSTFDKIYLNSYTGNDATFTVLINENPNSKTNIRTNITVRLTKESGSWLFPSDLNQGV